jgi:dimeric dUTPase (all-alpha-NTP-PPase superfamily)
MRLINLTFINRIGKNLSEPVNLTFRELITLIMMTTKEKLRTLFLEFLNLTKDTSCPDSMIKL